MGEPGDHHRGELLAAYGENELAIDTRVDASGVVSNRSTIHALGWQHGDQLHLTLLAGSLVVHRASGGVFRMPAKSYLVLPLAVRQRCGLCAGEQVAADPKHDVLVVHPLTALDAIVIAFHTALVGGDGDDRASG